MAQSARAKLILGTVQFGLDYGITNKSGRPDDNEMDAILLGVSGVVDTLDTSIKYGDALDRLSRTSAEGFSIVTKIQGNSPQSVAAEIQDTLDRLDRGYVEVVMFHDPKLFADRTLAIEVAAALQAEKNAGRIRRIGASLYDRRDVHAALDVFRPDVLQLPSSIADRRLLDDGTLSECAHQGIELHFRSLFLQGLLLQNAENLPPGFEGLAPLLCELDRLASTLKVSRQTLCLAWGANLPGAGGLVCGVSSFAEIQPLLNAYENAFAPPIEQGLTELARLIPVDAELLDPRTWPNLSKN